MHSNKIFIDAARHSAVQAFVSRSYLIGGLSATSKRNALKADWQPAAHLGTLVVPNLQMAASAKGCLIRWFPRKIDATHSWLKYFNRQGVAA